MGRQPTSKQVKACEKAFTEVDSSQKIPGGQALTVLVEHEGREGFLYDVTKRELGARISLAKKWILQSKLRRMLRGGRTWGAAVRLDHTINDVGFAQIGPGYRRGLVLASWKAKVCEAAGGKAWHDEFDRAWLTGEHADRQHKDYRHPMLIIKMRAGSMWITELHHRRYRIQWMINERFEEEFLKEVRIQ